MAQQILRDCEFTAADLDCVAVSRGPGSFTGIRIGVAAAKGLAWAAEKPCCGVSTLEAMAYQMRHQAGLLCPVMDARRAQVYNALFLSDGWTLTRLTGRTGHITGGIKKRFGKYGKTDNFGWRRQQTVL